LDAQSLYYLGLSLYPLSLALVAILALVALELVY
jgi:hypothetical protein